MSTQEPLLPLWFSAANAMNWFPSHLDVLVIFFNALFCRSFSIGRISSGFFLFRILPRFYWWFSVFLLQPKLHDCPPSFFRFVLSLFPFSFPASLHFFPPLTHPLTFANFSRTKVVPRTIPSLSWPTQTTLLSKVLLFRSLNTWGLSQF